MFYQVLFCFVLWLYSIKPHPEGRQVFSLFSFTVQYHFRLIKQIRTIVFLSILHILLFLFKYNILYIVAQWFLFLFTLKNPLVFLLIRSLLCWGWWKTDLTVKDLWYPRHSICSLLPLQWVLQYTKHKAIIDSFKVLLFQSIFRNHYSCHRWLLTHFEKVIFPDFGLWAAWCFEYYDNMYA